MAEALTLRDLLARQTRRGELFRDAGNGRIECFACGHRCLIGDGKDGICRVRFNRGGELFVPWGYVGGLQLDPIEKKPFFHVLPGSRALSFGMLGCDYHCAYCQNWVTSQALRDPAALSAPDFASPGEIAALALKHGAKVVTSTYNEPLITSEWGVEIFRIARSRGLLTSYVSNGNATPEVLDYLQPWVDLYKVDLKGFNDRQYRKLGGLLSTVVETIRSLHARGIWMEIVTLVVPGLNDTPEEFGDIARFIASVSPDIPWHVTAFHADYKMNDTAATPVKTLLRAADAGVKAGLKFVYAGNIPGEAGRWENTYCPGCGALLVERRGYTILRNSMDHGSCPGCRMKIPGVWEKIE